MTEETNMSSEQEKTQQAKTEQESPASESVKEPTVPLHEVTKIRTRAQVAEVEAANLRGQLTALQQTTVQTVKSPLEIAMAAEDVTSPDDLEKPWAVMEANNRWKQEQAEQAAQADATQAISQAQLASRELALVAHDDWQQVVNKAVAHMTKGEMIDLEAEGENFGEAIYTKSKEVLERVNPDKDTAPETSKSEAAEKAAAEKKAEEEAAEHKTPTQDEILADLKVDPVTEAASKL
ncbi:hypothetical protein LCGC14_0403480 [marine sediment metagenome]|uniref:Uncharacterized protein n=1 Tax=marine sediment metagenome TaxID=412755 RepID=A0A0F9SW89_9ZZZZ